MLVYQRVHGLKFAPNITRAACLFGRGATTNSSFRRKPKEFLWKHSEGNFLDSERNKIIYPLDSTNKKTWKITMLLWVNPLFLWPFSIVMLAYQRVIGRRSNLNVCVKQMYVDLRSKPWMDARDMCIEHWGVASHMPFVVDMAHELSMVSTHHPSQKCYWESPSKIWLRNFSK